MSDRPDNAPPEMSDSISIMSSNYGDSALTQAFPDILISAYIDGQSQEEFFKGKLDTGAEQDLISEHVVENRWGTELIDQTKAGLIYSLGMKIPTLGQIRIIVRLAPGVKEVEVPFQVIPTSVVRYRFDALLSAHLIKRRGILMLNSVYSPQDDEDTESDDCE